MDDPRKNRRIRHGLIPLMVAMRVMARREEEARKAAREAARSPDDRPPKRKRLRWFS
ncbi:MAG: hypothetical protein ACI9YM_001783 [Brevundimonas sp.]|jgi:hypothetical protein|uniref:hypothetical protein n=1 Tax=Brevundimonas sp. TaxID=1871086 RepID=UPI0024891A4C|nr:hypothetical protein [Brevundimonas sp.]MDI1282100.1 hypothetical protein [Brevundimonas sp.]